MDLKFHTVEFDGLGRRIKDKKLWTKLDIKFFDRKAKLLPGLAFTFALPGAPGTTIDTLEKEARAQAIILLKEATSILEKNDIASLSALQEKNFSENMSEMTEDIA